MSPPPPKEEYGFLLNLQTLTSAAKAELKSNNASNHIVVKGCERTEKPYLVYATYNRARAMPIQYLIAFLCHHDQYISLMCDKIGISRGIVSSLKQTLCHPEIPNSNLPLLQCFFVERRIETKCVFMPEAR